MSAAIHTTERDRQRKNLSIVRAAYAALLRDDPAAISAVSHPELAVHEAESLPYGGIYRGREAFVQAMAGALQLWDKPQIQVEQFLGGGDRVAVLLRFVAVHRASGKPFSTMIVEVWRLHEGQVVEILPFYWDTAAITALGSASHYVREPSY